MKYKPTIIAIGISILPIPVMAEDDIRVYLGGWSKHLNSKDLNETHNTIGVSYNNFEVLNFNNSYNKNSIQASYHHRFNNYFGIRLGIVSGYNNKKFSVGEFIPVVHPTFDIDLYKNKEYSLGIEFGYVPYSGGDSKGVMTLQTYFKF